MIDGARLAESLDGGAVTYRSNRHFDILNENILGRDILPEELASVDILCVSCMTATVQRGKAIARQYKDLRTQAGQTSRSIIEGAGSPVSAPFRRSPRGLASWRTPPSWRW